MPNENAQIDLNDVEDNAIDEQDDHEPLESEDSEPFESSDSESTIDEATDIDRNSEDQDESQITVSFGEEKEDSEETQPAPGWVRELRKQHRKQVKENRELKAKLEQLETTKQKIELGPKPTLEDVDYDTDEYNKQLDAWYQRKQAVDQQAAEREREQERQTEEWNRTLTAYQEKRASLKVADYEEAEAVIMESMDETQQGMILQGADNPALLVYALGKNPEKAHELAQIKDPVKFAFAVAKTETQLKVNKKTTKTQPEKTVSGKAPVSGSVDSTLERLRNEAMKTGDYSKVHRYKQQKRAAAR